VIFLFLFDSFGNLRRAGRKLEIAFRAVTMELNMSQVQGQTADALNGIQRSLHITRHTQITAVDMQGMRHLDFFNSRCKTFKMSRGVTP